MSNSLKPQNLRKNQDMTVLHKGEKKGGYDGDPMRFLGLSYPLIYVSVDMYRNGKYDFLTSYDLREVDVKPLPKVFLEAVQNKIKK